jgi:hypothetical protein
MENVEDPISRIAVLESQLDLLLTERSHLNRLLLECGFLEGIPTLMKTIEDLMKSGELDSSSGDWIVSCDQ